MAVDYTKVFTIIGKHVDKVTDYFAYVATFSTDQAAIETILASQSVVYLEGDLPDEFLSFKEDVTGWIDTLISRVSDVLTNETLIGVNFSFGAEPTITTVFPALIHDMALNDKNVTASAVTIGSPSYTMSNSLPGKLITGNKLDGVSPPIAGAQPIRDYAGLTTQLLPDSEVITFTCVADSEGGATRGGETFEITGTGPLSNPYEPLSENVGNLGTIQVADQQAGLWMAGPSFDTWDVNGPIGWTIDAGTESTDFEEGTPMISGSSFGTLQTGTAIEISQVLNSSSFQRLKAYFLTAWAKKVTDVETDQTIVLTIAHDGGTLLALNVVPTGTAWTLFSGQFVIPAEIEGDLY